MDKIWNKKSPSTNPKIIRISTFRVLKRSIFVEGHVKIHLPGSTFLRMTKKYSLDIPRKPAKFVSRGDLRPPLVDDLNDLNDEDVKVGLGKPAMYGVTGVTDVKGVGNSPLNGPIRGAMGRTEKITDPWIVEFYGLHVGKYTIYGSYGSVPMVWNAGMILQGMVKDVKLWNLEISIVMACFTLKSFLLVTRHLFMDIAMGWTLHWEG